MLYHLDLGNIQSSGTRRQLFASSIMALWPLLSIFPQQFHLNEHGRSPSRLWNPLNRAASRFTSLECLVFLSQTQGVFLLLGELKCHLLLITVKIH